MKLTKRLSYFIDLLSIFDCKVESGQSDYEYTTENDTYLEDVPYVSFDGWITIYHDENTNTFIVDHIISFGDDVTGELPDYKVFGTTDFYEALKYVCSVMIEWHYHTFTDKLADEAIYQELRG